MKNDRLKKMESELEDLEQWLRLGLVPKKDTEKHRDEIRLIQSKIDEERERLQFIKESGEQEEFIIPKRNARTSTYADGQNLPDIESNDDNAALTDVGGLDIETESMDVETTAADDTTADDTTADEEFTVYDDDEDPFSDRNRWKRGIADPEADDW